MFSQRSNINSFPKLGGKKKEKRAAEENETKQAQVAPTVVFSTALVILQVLAVFIFKFFRDSIFQCSAQ